MVFFSLFFLEQNNLISSTFPQRLNLLNFSFLFFFPSIFLSFLYVCLKGWNSVLHPCPSWRLKNPRKNKAMSLLHVRYKIPVKTSQTNISSFFYPVVVNSTAFCPHILHIQFTICYNHQIWYCWPAVRPNILCYLRVSFVALACLMLESRSLL